MKVARKVKKLSPTIETLVNELDLEIQRVWAEYADSYNKFTQYCEANKGRPMNECKDELNEMLAVIQSSFGALWPAYHFIDMRHQSSMNAVTGYNAFIENIKKSGGQQDEPSEPKIVVTS